MFTSPSYPAPSSPARTSTSVALSRKASVLIWWPPTHMIACFDPSTVGPVTPDNLLRWLNMLVDVSKNGELTIQRVSVRQWAPFMYSAKPLEKIPSSDVLDQGDYGCFYIDANNEPMIIRGRLPFNGLDRNPSLAKMKETYEASSTEAANYRIKHYTIPNEFQEVATRRDSAKCLFTGCTSSQDSPVDVYWIFPPGMADRITTLRGKRDGHLPPLTELFLVTDNLITVQAEIYQLWHMNAFSVDVDDGCRIRILTEEAKNAGLPDRLTSVPNRLASEFFREHFRHTLCVRFLGGDITVDPMSVPEHYVAHGLDEEGDINDFEPSNKVFQSDIGREVMVNTIRERLEHVTMERDDPHA